MHFTEHDKKPDNRVMTKNMIIILIITIMPLVVAFVVYLNNPDSPLLKSVSVATSSFPVQLSSNNPLLSSVMSAWCKTAPFWGVVLFLVSFKHIQIKGGQSAGTMLKGLAQFSLLYFPITYMLLFYSTEFSESGKLLRLMSQNDFSLAFLFMTIYTLCYIYTAYYLLFLAAVCKTLNQNKKRSFKQNS